MGDPASPRQRLHLDCQWEILRVEVRGVLSWLREAVRAFIPDFNGDNWRWDLGIPLRDITMLASISRSYDHGILFKRNLFEMRPEQREVRQRQRS